MGNLSAFARPQKLIDRAKAALTDANNAWKAFFEVDNAEIIIEDDPEPGFQRRKLAFKAAIPDAVEGRLTDAMNNARNAFDQSIFAACAAIDRPRKDTHYPWASSETDLTDWRLWNNKSGKETIPKELWDVLISQEPYPRNEANGRGNTLIRAMATLANRKHTVGIEVFGKVAAMHTGSTVIQGVGGVFIMPTWDPIKNEIILSRWKGTAQFSGEESFEFDVVFDATAPIPLPRMSAALCMDAFINHAQFACDGLKARAAELGAT